MGGDQRSEGSSSYVRMEVGTRYVIFAQKSLQAGGPRLSTRACSGTFLPRGGEAVADALRNAVRGGAARILGSVRTAGDYKAVAGASVMVRSDTNQYAVSTGVDGRYKIRGMVPGRYQIEVSKPGYAGDPLYKKYSSLAALNQSHTTAEIENGTYAVVETGLWEDGTIPGIVIGQDGEVLEASEVQEFEGSKERMSPIEEASRE